MKKLVMAASVVSGLLLSGGDLFGHGGVYRGPGDVVPPSEGGGPGTGGPNTGGPTTPGPSGPSTPGGRGPTTPGGPAGPGGGGSGPRGPSTPGGGGQGKKSPRGEGFEQWQFWWEYNKDRYLNLRESLATKGQRTGNAGFLGGLGTKTEASSTNRPSDDQILNAMVPTLRDVLGEDDADIVDSAVLAIARMVRADAASSVLADIQGTLGNTNPSVKQSAILSLGVLGHKDAVPLLTDILNDTPAGRNLLKERNGIQDLPRAFAAIALGYIGAPESISTLHDVITKNDNSEIDIRSSAILALGMFDEGKEEIVPFLMDLLKDEKLDRTTRAQVPISLGRLGDVADPAINELLNLLKGRKTDIRLEESACIALGQLAGPSDQKVIDTLIDLIGESNNEQARHFSFISLAQIAGKALKEKGNEAVVTQIVDRFLLKELTSPKKGSHQPWAGLSLALIGREMGDDNFSSKGTIITKLHEAFKDTNNPSFKSCFAVGLGLVKAGGVQAEDIYKELEDTKDLDLKGYLALSLGMQNYTEASASLNGMVLDNRDPKMRLQVATALGLMGDRNALKTLLDALKSAETLNVISSLAKAIGLIGDSEAIQPLQELIKDERAPGLARAFGCVALGLVGEKTPLPWNVELIENANYRTVLSPLYEIADIL